MSATNINEEIYVETKRKQSTIEKLGLNDEEFTYPTEVESEEQLLRKARIYNALIMGTVAVEACVSFVSPLFFTIGISKVFEQVLGSGSITAELDYIWRNLLMADWTFEAYLTFFVTFYAIAGAFDASWKGAAYYLSKRVELFLKVKLAQRVLTEGDAVRLDEIAELTKAAAVIRVHIEEVKYDEVWSYIFIVFGTVFTFVVAPILAGILAVSADMLPKGISRDTVIISLFSRLCISASLSLAVQVINGLSNRKRTG